MYILLCVTAFNVPTLHYTFSIHERVESLFVLNLILSDLPIFYIYLLNKIEWELNFNQSKKRNKYCYYYFDAQEDVFQLWNKWLIKDKFLGSDKHLTQCCHIRLNEV